MNKKYTSRFVRFVWITVPIGLLISCSTPTLEDELEGCWVREDAKVMECWTKTDDGFIGEGLAIRGHGDTTQFERLRITTEGGNRVYIADVDENEGAVSFPETNTPWLFENPEHDMPQRIRYKLIDERLVVTLESENGKLTWSFQRLKE